MMLGLTFSLPLPSNHMCKLSVTTSNFFSIRDISHWNNLPGYVVADFEWFKKMKLINFLWTSDWHWNLITVLPYFVDYTHCLSFNKYIYLCYSLESLLYMTMMTEATHGSSHEQAPKACDGGMSVLNTSAHNKIHCGYSGIRGPLVSHKP